MINIKLDQETYKKIIVSMRNIEKSEESVIKTAVNNTAKRAQKLLIQQTRNVYGGEAPATLHERTTIKKATTKNPGVVIRFKSEQHDLTKFRKSITGSGQTKTMFIGGKRIAFPVYGSQLKDGSLKCLKSETGLAFSVELSNGKIIIASRVPGNPRSKKTGNVQISAFMGSSDKIMVSSNKVYGKVKDDIADMLYKQCEKVLSKVLGGK